jgi:hypothetical protein
MDEEWKTIEEYPNYSISNLGVVRNNITGLIKTNSINSRGYYYVTLYKNNIKKHFRVHRLIGQYFVDGFNPNLVIDHIDRNTQNNDILNLRWVTQGENIRNASKQANCSSIYKGVSFDKSRNKWEVCTQHLKKRFYLGRFDSEEEAHQKYLEWNAERNFIV